MEQFDVFYPGQYDEADQLALDKALVEFDRLNNRGDVDIQALIDGTLPKDTPGLVPPTQAVHVVGTEEARRKAFHYDHENPLYTDSDYARSVGYKDKVAFPTIFADGGYWPMMGFSKDFTVISSLNHRITLHKPIYEGDKLFTIIDKQGLEDITIPGSEYRTFDIFGDARTFNQDGELVVTSRSRVVESYHRYSDKSLHKDVRGDFWECPIWWDRPRHFYTDADWNFIKETWKNEIRRGKEPLYWEDVQIGDQPNPTLDGPIVNMDTIKYHGYEETYAPTLKDRMLDPIASQMLLRNERDGIYWFGPGVGHFDYGMDPNRRPAFYNYLGRDFAVRMLSNWYGDFGRLEGINWEIMTTMPGYEGKIPERNNPSHYLEQVPGMEGARVNIHGLVGDISLNKAAVVDKYIENGKHMVKLVWWCETIDGDIFQEGEAFVSLPTR